MSLDPRTKRRAIARRRHDARQSTASGRENREFETPSASVSFQTPRCLGWPPSASNGNRDLALERDRRRSCRSCGHSRLMRGRKARQPSVKRSAERVGTSEEEWLPEANAFSNSGKREHSAFPAPPVHVSVRNCVGFGTEQDGNSDSGRSRGALLRHESIIGDRLRARTEDAQAVEAMLACNVLNRMTALGRPKSVAIAR